MIAAAAAREGRIRLPDGRAIAFAQYGNDGGTPVVFFQGTPSSRLMHPPEAVTREMNARLIVIDRPGFGGSDASPGRTLRDWPSDVAAVLAHLGIGEFVTTGVSGGGPYVLATACCLPDRVRAASICGGSGPLELPGALRGAAPARHLGYLLARHAPGLFRWVVRHTTDPRKDPAKFVRRYTSHNPPADQNIIADPVFREMYLANFAEALCQGFDAFAEEVILASRPWGFSLGDIAVPVRIWQGELDNGTPLGMAKGMAERIPSSTLTVLPGQGHMFIYGPLWRSILGDLLAARSRNLACAHPPSSVS
jgi:pimeloyl-ACP methyl ester carboxylesterase